MEASKRVPILKIGFQNEIYNYTPISLLSINVKARDRCSYNYVCFYLSVYSFFCANQSDPFLETLL